MKFSEHMQECLEKLGDSPDKREIFEEVNHRLDQFAHYPDWNCLKQHRQFLHHEEGIAYFGRRFGRLGAEAARLHVLSDCNKIPKAIDYHNGVVDGLGMLTARARGILGALDIPRIPEFPV